MSEQRPTRESMSLAGIIHEHFCCNRRSAALAREASFVKCEAQDEKSVSVSSHARYAHGWRERRMGKDASLGKEAVLADSGRVGEIAAGVGRVRRATFSASC
jgi:hypothetical protein